MMKQGATADTESLIDLNQAGMWNYSSRVVVNVVQHKAHSHLLRPALFEKITAAFHHEKYFLKK